MGEGTVALIDKEILMSPRSSDSQRKPPVWMDTVKYLLPMAIAAVGVYVGLVIAPLDTRITSIEQRQSVVEADHKKVMQTVHELIATRSDILRRVAEVEASIRKHVDMDHERFMSKDDTRRELSRLREDMRQLDSQLRDILREYARHEGRDSKRPSS